LAQMTECDGFMVEKTCGKQVVSLEMTSAGCKY